MAAGAEQADLFATPTNAPAGEAVEPTLSPDASTSDSAHTAASMGTVASAAASAGLAAVATALPRSICLGTSSWAFPGWAGLVYAREESASQLARHGLAAYAKHPLLRAVGLDRTFYAPISEQAFAAYARDVPAGFQFLVKAHGDLTTPGGLHRRTGAQSAPAADRFLDASYAAEAVVAPAVAGLGGTLGVLLFQFPPLRQSGAQARRFPERLAAFLSALPRGVPYAVEIRNAELLTPAYVSALAEHGATHCYNVHPSMPDVLAQRAAIGSALDTNGPVAVRWMLRPDQQYESARAAWAPFDALVAPDLTSRTQIAELLRVLSAATSPVIVIANNKAEGSAPRTLAELAHLVAPVPIE